MARDILDVAAAARAEILNLAARMRGAADVLAHPDRCNQRPWDDAVEALLRSEADRYDQETAPAGVLHPLLPVHCGLACSLVIVTTANRLDRAHCTCFDGPLAVADAILAPATGGA